MKVKIFIWALMLIWFISCSIPSDASDDIMFENYKINIVFDRESFEFNELELKVKLDPIAFPESLKVAPVRDETSQDFNDFVVEGGTKSKYLQYDSGASHPTTTVIRDSFYTDSIVNIPGNAQYLWAKTDSLRVNFSLENNYNELAFDSLNIVILRHDSLYLGVPFSQANRTVVDTTFYDFQPGTTKADYLLLDNAWITKDMTLRLIAYNRGLTLTQPLDATQNLYFNIIFDDCTFHKAFANFNAQVENQTDTYSRGDVSEYGNIKLRSIILKDFQFSVDSRNETDLYVEIDGHIDNFYDLRLGENYLVDVDTLKINPNSDSIDVVGPYMLDSCRFNVNFAEQSATVTHDSWGRAADTSSTNPYVHLDRLDSVHFYFEIESANPGQDYVPFYEFDGYVENETIQISETTSGFADEIDWDDYNGVTLNMMNLKAEASFSRDSLIMDVIILENFRMRGIKAGVPQATWINLKDTTLVNFNNGILDLIELDTGGSFSDLINYKPDTIEYMADATMTFNGILKYDDKLQLELLVTTPLEITITDEFVKELEVHEMDSLGLNEGSEILSLKINSFINNPPDESDRNAIIKFTINISDSVIQTVSSEEDSLLTGDVKEIFSMFITSNPDGFPDGYMLNNLVDNQGLDIDEEGISLPPEIINMMIEKKTYMQEVITIKPEIPGGEVYLSDTGFIEVQTKISGELNLSTGGGK